MAKRPTTTIILITRGLIARADFTSTRTLQGIWSQARPDVQEWPALVEIALDLGATAPGKVFVLSTELWSQTLTLNQRTQGMSPADLRSALSFEAEEQSGYSPLDAVIEYQTLPAGEGYWIAQVRLADLLRIEEMVARAGSRLGGISHPGGVPVSLNTREAEWARLEFWPDAVVLARGDWRNPPSVRVLNADPQLGRWRTEWDQWRGALPSTDLEQVLVGPGINTAAPAAAETVLLNDDAKLATWLTAWANHLTGKTAVPLLRPPKKPMTNGQRSLIAIGLAAAVVLACVGVHLWLNEDLRAAQTEIKAAIEPGKKIEELKKQIKEQETKQADLKAKLNDHEESIKVLNAQRGRIAKLLESVAEHRMKELDVHKIEAEVGEPRIAGVCLRPELADQFASKLGQALAAQGWHVNAPKKKALNLAADGGPWSFEIRLTTVAGFVPELKIDPKKAKK